MTWQAAGAPSARSIAAQSFPFGTTVAKRESKKRVP